MSSFQQQKRLCYLLLSVITAVVQINGSNEYIGVTLALSFADADTYCKTTYKTHLASVYSDNDMIKTKTVCQKIYAEGDRNYAYYGGTYTYCWLGLDGSATSAGASITTYTWTDDTGTPSTYTPSIGNITGGECSTMRSSTGDVYDHGCISLRAFICNAPKYIAEVSLKTRAVAQTHCYDTFGTSLASSHSNAEDYEMFELAAYIHTFGDQGSSQYSSSWLAVFIGFDAAFYYNDTSTYDHSSVFGMYVLDGGTQCGVVFSHDGK